MVANVGFLLLAVYVFPWIQLLGNIFPEYSGNQSALKISVYIVWLVSIAAGIALLWISFAATAKRFHDRDKSGWWVLIGLIPILGNLWILVECGMMPGTTDRNRFAEEPPPARFDVPMRAARTLFLTVLVLFGLICIGAFFIPTHQDYARNRVRAEVSEGVSLTSQFKPRLDHYFSDKGTFTGLNDNVLNGETTTGAYVSKVTIETAHDKTAVIAAIFKRTRVASQIAGKELRMATLDGGATWYCGDRIPKKLVRHNQVPSKYLPGSCTNW